MDDYYAPGQCRGKIRPAERTGDYSASPRSGPHQRQCRRGVWVGQGCSRKDLLDASIGLWLHGTLQTFYREASTCQIVTKVLFTKRELSASTVGASHTGCAVLCCCAAVLRVLHCAFMLHCTMPAVAALCRYAAWCTACAAVAHCCLGTACAAVVGDPSCGLPFQGNSRVFCAVLVVLRNPIMLQNATKKVLSFRSWAGCGSLCIQKWDSLLQSAEQRAIQTYRNSTM